MNAELKNQRCKCLCMSLKECSDLNYLISVVGSFSNDKANKDEFS